MVAGDAINNGGALSATDYVPYSPFVAVLARRGSTIGQGSRRPGDGREKRPLGGVALRPSEAYIGGRLPTRDRASDRLAAGL
jgi:hypothetical protein